MLINKVSNQSFKSYVPVVCMAKNPNDNEYLQVMKKENLRKCHGYLVRNLNGTIKNPNDEFVKYYKEQDKDYSKNPVVHSFYPKSGNVVYLVTGKDVDVLNQMGKKLGIAKSESIRALGHTKSFEVHQAAKEYVNSAEKFIKNIFKPLKSSDDNSNLVLYAYFNPEYTKKDNKLKGFKFVNAQFEKQK